MSLDDARLEIQEWLIALSDELKDAKYELDDYDDADAAEVAKEYLESFAEKIEKFARS